MKKILPILFLSSLVLVGCEEALLNKRPVTTLNPTTFWQNGEEAEMAVNALYTFLPDIFQVYYDNKTDISVQPYTGGNVLVNGNVEVTTGEFASIWQSHFRAVAAANRFLEDVNTVPGDQITEALLSRLKAEARFVRAVNYTYLVNYFGDVPFLTSELSVSEASQVHRTDKDEVLQFIETELTEIASILPKEYTGDDIGRITKGGRSPGKRARCCGQDSMTKPRKRPKRLWI